MAKSLPLVLLVLAGLMLVVAVTTARGMGPPRRCDRAACRILQPVPQRWVCPMFPGGAVVVSRSACFIIGWPEP